MLPSSTSYDVGYDAWGSYNVGMSPMTTVSSRTYTMSRGDRPVPVTYSNQPLERAPTKEHMECDGECAEEECLDPDKCGNDNRPPKPEHLLCGWMDTRPLLPISLAVSTVIGMMVMMLLQLPLVSRLFDTSLVGLSCVSLAVYGITLGCMTYTAFTDPGQMRKDANSAAGGEVPMPMRAYKSWQYKRPVRRFDHYCRWLNNCIGLLNHREFFAMLVGLLAIAVFGITVDVMLAISMINRGFWSVELLIVLHLAYSVALLCLAGPIVRIHVGLVSRNELAAEWKRNDFYVAKSLKHGEFVPVHDLSDDEFNLLFDSLVYDQKRNAYDRGGLKNCFTFWCIPRWLPDQLGEF